LIRFIWTRLIHTPFPSKLVYIESYSTDYIVNYYSDDDIFTSKSDYWDDLVRLLISVSFDIQCFSPSFSYQGRTIATPFLSASGLEDPVKDWRLLGNCVYSPGLSRFNPWSFRDVFTGVDDLGFYDFNLPKLSKQAVINYYVVDLAGNQRISSFFVKYEKAKDFAEKIFGGHDNEVGSFFIRPVAISSIRSCIRRLKHPIGVFAYVQTMAGSIHASELLFEFRNRLMHGGGN